MDSRIKKLLLDVQLSIQMIQDFTAKRPLKGPEDVEQDWIIEDGLSRRMAIIGEAVYQLQRRGLHLRHGDWIINFRNTLVHQYDATTPETLWERIQRDLPQLLEEVEKELKA